MRPIPVESLRATLSNQPLEEAIYASTRRLMEKRAASIPEHLREDFQKWREQAHRIKRHTLENLDYYLELLEDRLRARGGKLVYARDGAEVARFITEVAKERGVRLVVKSKSMTTEEIHLNEWLEREGIETVETDLGEYIIQLAGERPSHIVAPALHKTRYQIADLFHEKLRVEREEEPEKQTLIARRVLREKFLSAGLGVTGANFVVAESGSIAIIENEGNARLCSSLPPIHIAVAGIEKLVPRARDLAVFFKLLGRSGTGQPLTVYTSLLTGPRREGEIDGPEEFYLVLLDSGRTKVLAEPRRRESLYCIRCGACLNHCPVYRKIGGHNYPWVYSGPIGAIITPQFHGMEKDWWLPFASSLCGACGEVCPVKIDIPRILLDLRAEAVREKIRSGEARLERLAFRLWAWVMTHPKVYEAAGLFNLALRDDESGWKDTVPGVFHAGPLKEWLRFRKLPAPPAKTFRDLWAARRQKEALEE